MAIGYANNGMDFDDIFEPRTGTKRADVGYAVNGVDISNFYEPAASGTPAGNVGYSTNGTDIGPLFAAKGGVVYWDGTLDDLPSFDSYRNNGGDGQNYALIEYALLANGDIRYRNNKGTSEVIVGSWLGTVANSSNTEVKCVVVSVDVQVGGGTYGGSPSTYQSIATSPGIIVVQTGTTEPSRLAVTFDVYLREVGDPASEIVKRVTLDATYNTGPI